MQKLALFSSFASLFAIVACSSTVTSTGGTGSTAGASSMEVSQCHDGCDQAKFFGCSSAAEQNQCYMDCGSATSQQIAAFNGCSNTSICDPACRNDIAPPASNGSKPTTGTGASASTCSTACMKLVMCSFIQVGAESSCEMQCQQQAYQYQIDCVNNNACGDIKNKCGATTGGSSGGGTTDAGTGGTDQGTILACQSECDQLLSQECISASDQSACRSHCSTASSASDMTFTTCVNSSGGQCSNATACYTTFSAAM